jgi:hypothetical protein
MLDSTDIAIPAVPDEMLPVCDRKLREGIPRACPLAWPQHEVSTAKLGQLKTIMQAPQTACLSRFFDRRAIHEPHAQLCVVLWQEEARSREEGTT